MAENFDFDQKIVLKPNMHVLKQKEGVDKHDYKPTCPYKVEPLEAWLFWVHVSLKQQNKRANEPGNPCWKWY